LQKISSPNKEPLASQKNLPYAVSQSVSSFVMNQNELPLTSNFAFSPIFIVGVCRNNIHK